MVRGAARSAEVVSEAGEPKAECQNPRPTSRATYSRISDGAADELDGPEKSKVDPKRRRKKGTRSYGREHGSEARADLPITPER